MGINQADQMKHLCRLWPFASSFVNVPSEDLQPVKLVMIHHPNHPGSSHDVAGSPSGSSSTKPDRTRAPGSSTTRGLPGIHWAIVEHFTPNSEETVAGLRKKSLLPRKPQLRLSSGDFKPEEPNPCEVLIACVWRVGESMSF